MVKAILWDNDGVLVDTEHLYYRATQRVLESVGITLTEEMFIDLFLVQAVGAWHLAEASGISQDDVSRLREQRNSLYLSYLQAGNTAIVGVEQVLKRLHGTYRMGIVTSAHREHFDAIHATTGLTKYFDFVLASEDYTQYKPDPEPYLLAIQRMGFGANECIAVEDSQRGLRSAVGAGLRCVVIPRGLTRSGSFPGAYKVMNDINELPPVVEELSARSSHPPSG